MYIHLFRWRTWRDNISFLLYKLAYMVLVTPLTRSDLKISNCRHGSLKESIWHLARLLCIHRITHVVLQWYCTEGRHPGTILSGNESQQHVTTQIFNTLPEIVIWRTCCPEVESDAVNLSFRSISYQILDFTGTTTFELRDFESRYWEGSNSAFILYEIIYTSRLFSATSCTSLLIKIEGTFRSMIRGSSSGSAIERCMNSSIMETKETRICQITTETSAKEYCGFVTVTLPPCWTTYSAGSANRCRKQILTGPSKMKGAKVFFLILGKS